MKVPGTFLPEIGLDGKIVDLLERTTSSPKYKIDQDVKNIFPNFVSYLKEKYGNLRIYRSRHRYSSLCWRIMTITPLNKKKALGTIRSYSYGLSEHGYTANVKIDKKLVTLIYRDGHGNPFTKYTKNPLRCDYEDIPFP